MRTIADGDRVQGWRLSLDAEAWLPTASWVVVFVAILLWGDSIVAALAAKTINLISLYGAAFNWAAIQAGFTIGVYAFALGHGGDFLQKVRKTQAFTMFTRYIETAAVLSFFLAVITIPIIVAEPAPTSSNSLVFYFINFWFSTFIATIASFWRVAYIFWLLARIKDRVEFRG